MHEKTGENQEARLGRDYDLKVGLAYLLLSYPLNYLVLKFLWPVAVGATAPEVAGFSLLLSPITLPVTVLIVFSASWLPWLATQVGLLF